jgi:hypothetical protein
LPICSSNIDDVQFAECFAEVRKFNDVAIGTNYVDGQNNRIGKKGLHWRDGEYCPTFALGAYCLGKRCRKRGQRTADNDSDSD